MLTFDNIDRQQESLTGGGTPHRVNGIIVQPKWLTCAPPQTTSTTAKTDKRRSIQPSEKLLPVYSVGKRKGPPTVKSADLSGTLADAASTAQRSNHLWVLTRLLEPYDQKISPRKAFNIITRDHVDMEEDVVGYLPTINAPATEMSTVQEILRNTLNIMSSLQLEHVAVLFDQALFAKATE